MSAISPFMVLSLMGTAVEAVGQLQQAQAASQAAAYNAQVAEMEAKAIKISGEREAEKLIREKRMTVAEQKVAYAKAGVRLVGSPFEVLSDVATQYQMDIEATKYATRVGVTRARTEAQIYRQKAGAYRTAGFIGAGTTLLTGMYQPRTVKVGYGAVGYGARI